MLARPPPYARLHACTHAGAHTHTHTRDQIPKIQNCWNNFTKVNLVGKTDPPGLCPELAGLDHIGAVTDMVRTNYLAILGS